jgi:hypothetical protein
MREWRNGRRVGLKHQWLQGRASSSLASRTFEVACPDIESGQAFLFSNQSKNTSVAPYPYL